MSAPCLSPVHVLRWTVLLEQSNNSPARQHAWKWTRPDVISYAHSNHTPADHWQSLDQLDMPVRSGTQGRGGCLPLAAHEMTVTASSAARTPRHTRGSARAGRSSRTTGLKTPTTTPSITPELVADYRPRARDLSRRITQRIRREVVSFNDPNLHDLISEALDTAVSLFIDSLAGASSRGGSVANIYRRLGELEALAGHAQDGGPSRPGHAGRL